MADVILDTNILLLFIVGTTNPNYIEKFKRTSAYTKEDFQTLLDIFPSDVRIIFPPHVAAEAGNFLDKGKDPMSRAIFSRFKDFLSVGGERYSPSVTAAARSEFERIGLTDSVLLELAACTSAGKPAHLFTADLDLAVAAEMAGYEVTNFAHLIK